MVTHPIIVYIQPLNTQVHLDWKKKQYHSFFASDIINKKIDNKYSYCRLLYINILNIKKTSIFSFRLLFIIILAPYPDVPAAVRTTPGLTPADRNFFFLQINVVVGLNPPCLCHLCVSPVIGKVGLWPVLFLSFFAYYSFDRSITWTGFWIGSALYWWPVKEQTACDAS